MPMIDVYAAADLFPADADRKLAEELTAALLRAEGVQKPGPTHLNNTGAFIHRMTNAVLGSPGSSSSISVVGRSHQAPRRQRHRGAAGTGLGPRAKSLFEVVHQRRSAR